MYNTSLISAYFGLDSRECKCLEYLFIINPVVAFYDIHGGKRQVLLFILFRTPDETQPHTHHT
jgi:hypothetical protein